MQLKNPVCSLKYTGDNISKSYFSKITKNRIQVSGNKATPCIWFKTCFFSDIKHN